MCACTIWLAYSNNLDMSIRLVEFLQVSVSSELQKPLFSHIYVQQNILQAAKHEKPYFTHFGVRHLGMEVN